MRRFENDTFESVFFKIVEIKSVVVSAHNHSTYYLYVTVHKVHRYTYERDLMSVDGWFWLESNTFCDIVNKVRPRLMDPVGSVQFQIRLDERSQLDFFFGLFHYY